MAHWGSNHRDGHAVRRRRPSRRGRGSAADAAPGRQRLGRARPGRHDRARARRSTTTRSCVSGSSRSTRSGDAHDLIANTGSNDTAPLGPPDRARDASSAWTRSWSSRPTTTSRTGAGSSPTSRRARAGHGQADRRLQHPLALRGRHPERPAAPSWRRSRTSSAVKQARDEDVEPRSTAWTCSPATTTCSPTVMDVGGTGGILVASHLFGPEMKRIVEEPDARAEVDEQPARRLRRARRHRQPDPGQDGAAHARARSRATSVCRWSRRRRKRQPRCARCSSGTACCQRGLSGTLRVLPLGGLGEIGKNMTVVEYDGRIVVDRHRPDVPDARPARASTSCCPDFSYLRERADDIEAIFLTHGHEDHVGALPYVLRELGRAPADLRRPADDRDGPVEARRAPHQGRRTCEDIHAGRRASPPGRSRSSRSRSSHSIPDMLAAAITTRTRHDPRSPATTSSTRRRSTASPPTSRGWPSSGRDGRAAAVRRLDQRRPPRLVAVGVERRAAARGGVRALRGPDPRHLLRVEHPPRAAGRRRRRGARPQGRAGRPVDAQEREHRPQPRPHRDPRGDARRGQGDRGLPGPQDGRDLDRVAGRAAVGAAAHGARRPPERRAAPGRHGRSSPPRRSPATSARSTRRSTASTSSAPT